MLKVKINSWYGNDLTEYYETLSLSHSGYGVLEYHELFSLINTWGNAMIIPPTEEIDYYRIYLGWKNKTNGNPFATR